MLKKISSDAFRIGKIKRPPIEFKEGLNVVLGSGKSANSIGKSTLLLAIDFCFGGDDYRNKQKNLIENHVGHHSIEFEFEFNGVSKYFRRSTDDYNHVDICDENYNFVRRITNAQFCESLRKYYGLKDVLSFREWVSPFYRIYNRGNYNETKPINAHFRQLESNGIINLLKMYDAYDLDNSYQEKLTQLKEDSVYYKKSPKYRGFEEIKDDTELAELEVELRSLKAEYEKLEEENRKGISDAATGEESRKAILSDQYKKINREINRYQNKIKSIDSDISYNEEEYAKVYKALKEFFPNEEDTFRKIEELEKFHKKVASIVNAEATQNIKKYQDLIDTLLPQLDVIDKELQKHDLTPNINEEIKKNLEFYKEKIRVIEDRIDTYKKLKQTTINLTTTQNQFDEAVFTSTSTIAKRLNTKMKEFNDHIREDEKRRAPIFSFNGTKSYAFFTPNDDGTGTRYKALCLLDLAILTDTNLPAIIHDSIIYTNIEVKSVIDLCKLYQDKTDKQIFIAITDSDSYYEGDKNIMIERKVIELGEKDNALFGRQFNLEK